MDSRAIQTCLRAGIADRAVPVGPFLVLVHPDSANPFLNYAVPVDGAAPTAADVSALVEFCRQRERLPRLEYVRPAPDVDRALVDAGFDVAATLTLMALAEFAPPPECPGYRVRPATAEADLAAAVRVQNVAYGEPDLTADPIGLPRLVAAGGRVVIAETEAGTLVGAGVCPAPRDGLVEIFGVAVAPEHRRRGLARLITGELTSAALRHGHQPFLQVEKDEPARIYERLGYRVVGELADARLA
jgi:ribosomal protein S18 acetylase RimI-like enzyme